MLHARQYEALAPRAKAIGRTMERKSVYSKTKEGRIDVLAAETFQKSYSTESIELSSWPKLSTSV